MNLYKVELSDFEKECYCVAEDEAKAARSAEKLYKEEFNSSGIKAISVELLATEYCYDDFSHLVLNNEDSSV